ncbi:MAG: T9SS type A sorting domain-containing protein [Muribaculaceae bacterium]|nr:T9SS type A sorting domain-containing protein [Muribaculaceae bacterium]MDE7097242.1 T9SS type A sorting domain-containing protein [Muribaculaceae bacterium]
MFRRLCVLLAAVALSASPVSFLSFGKGWEPVRTDVSGLSSVARDNDVEIRVSPGHVVVVSSAPTQIKVFTILGQVVSDEAVPAGINRLSLSHGVYIVKVGDLTCKVAV